MTEQKEHLQTLTDIRSMMERSSRCISLSGLSGVFSGIFALIGAYLAQTELDKYEYYDWSSVGGRFESWNIAIYFIEIGAVVLFLSLVTGTFLTIRNSKRKGIKVWDSTSKRLLINLGIPLVAGGLFCSILLYHQIFGLIGPATLIFYGLALINASKYTFNDIRYLGLCEILLGLLASIFFQNWLLFWAIGFGVLHIVYGAVMYLKYERK
ncbi:hypothetical protein BH10BAC1_BH10BAC1_09590 [soil metagenome]